MYKICFYVPSAYLEQVKDAMFAAGAGKIGNYGHCAWEVAGQGQFMALNGSNAFIGKKNQLELVQEYKVELVCEEIHIKKVITALKSTHPYETPAYQVFKMESF